MTRANTSPIEHLYTEHNAWLRDWFRIRLGCNHQAADLAQDTFVRVLLRREELRTERLQQPRAFLRVIAKGLLVDHFRRKDVERAFREALSVLPEPEALSPEAKEILLQTLQQIDAVLDRLPRAVRHAFLLSQLDGLTYDEIAGQMNLSVRTVKRYMRQGFSQCLSALV